MVYAACFSGFSHVGSRVNEGISEFLSLLLVVVVGGGVGVCLDLNRNFCVSKYE